MNWGTGQTSPATDACVANAGQTCTINESTGYELTVYTYYFNSACDITRVFLDYQAFGIHPDEDMVPTPGYPIRPGQTATSSTKFVYGAVISHTNSSSPGCPPGSVLNAAGSCVTQTYAQAPPDCANLDFVKDVCFLAAAASCPAGLSYSSTLGLCAQAPDCAGGALDTGASVCAQEATVACPSGTGWTGSLCAVSATCPTGTSLGGDGVCRANPSCPDGTTLSGGTCVSPPPCPPGTVSPPANICVAAPECPAGTTLSSGTCLGQSTPHCPAGYQLDGTVCHQPPQCAVGSYTAFADTCFAGSNPCPVGYAINKVTDVCGKSPTCPQGGSYNLDTDLCRAEPAYTCAAPGYSYDPGTGACWTLAVCNQSTLNPLTDSCEVKATPNCGMRAYDPAEKVCHEPVNCRNGGVYSLANSQCELTPGMDCGDWILNPATRLCEEPPLCPGTPGFPLAGSLVFDASLDKCSVDAMHDDCLPDYTYQPQPVGMCEKPVTCSQGEYDPVTDTCPGVWNCPLGGQFACADIGTGTPQCSPVACTDPALDTTPEEEADTSALINDGTVDEAGNCDGLWMIFNGKGQECLPSGWSTSFFDCCKTGSDSFLFIEKTCSKQAYEVAVAREAGRTHYVGTYCKKKIKLIGCVQRARVFCVFNSKMGRIIQEGCRPQLADFGPDGGWGTAKAPNCVGLTPEQFQSCDFGKIDFAEMQGDFAPNLNNVAPSIQGAIDGYMQNIR